MLVELRRSSFQVEGGSHSRPAFHFPRRHMPARLPRMRDIGRQAKRTLYFVLRRVIRSEIAWRFRPLRPFAARRERDVERRQAFMANAANGFTGLHYAPRLFFFAALAGLASSFGGPPRPSSDPIHTG